MKFEIETIGDVAVKGYELADQDHSKAFKRKKIQPALNVLAPRRTRTDTSKIILPLSRRHTFVSIDHNALERFLSIAGARDPEREIIRFANRYGPLLSGLGPWESVDFWVAKSAELGVAAQLRNEMTKSQLKAIRPYFQFDTVSVSPELSGRFITLRFRVRGALTALWLQWVGVQGKFRGFCECGSPIFGKTNKQYCSDNCRAAAGNRRKASA